MVAEERTITRMFKEVRNHKILNKPIAALILLILWGYGGLKTLKFKILPKEIR